LQLFLASKQIERSQFDIACAAYAGVAASSVGQPNTFLGRAKRLLNSGLRLTETLWQTEAKLRRVEGKSAFSYHVRGKGICQPDSREKMMASIARLAPDLPAQLQRCIELCQSCHDMCLNTLNYCLQQGGRHTEEQHLRLMMDCAQICQVSADFMLRDSAFHARVCGACADVCESCADSCGTMNDDERMKDCADHCRECATLCRDLSVSGSA